MECVNVGKYLFPLFMFVLPLSLFAVWRMKENVIEGFDEKFEGLPFYKKIVGDFILSKSLLTDRGKKWHLVGLISGAVLIVFFVAYIYFNNQSWVCSMGPEKHPLDIIKNAFKGS
jgi:hypothetical protein